jgi:hypothetical protein
LLYKPAKTAWAQNAAMHVHAYRDVRTLRHPNGPHLEGTLIEWMHIEITHVHIYTYTYVPTYIFI